jgi:tRNA pseudouridine65 synthase
MQVLFHDDCLVAVNKPAGLLVHRSAIDQRERRFAMQLLRDQIGRRVYPLHRLDRPTSGVLLFALNVDVARCMSEQFSRGGVDKTYLAVVRGYTDEMGLIDYPLRERHDQMTDARADSNKPAQSALTAYRRLARVELACQVGPYSSARYSLLEVKPKTGRKHQIRRHMKHIFHPVVGDTTHGDGKHNQLFRNRFACHRLLLAATRLELPHPRSGERLCIDAPLPDDFRRIIDTLGWSGAA